MRCLGSIVELSEMGFGNTACFFVGVVNRAGCVFLGGGGDSFGSSVGTQVCNGFLLVVVLAYWAWGAVSAYWVWVGWREHGECMGVLFCLGWFELLRGYSYGWGWGVGSFICKVRGFLYG